MSIEMDLGEDIWLGARQKIDVGGVEFRIPDNYRLTEPDPPEAEDVDVYYAEEGGATCWVYAHVPGPFEVGPQPRDELFEAYSARLDENQRILLVDANLAAGSRYSYVLIEEELEYEDGEELAASDADRPQYECILSLNTTNLAGAAHFQGFFDAQRSEDAYAAASKFLQSILGNCIAF